MGVPGSLKETQGYLLGVDEMAKLTLNGDGASVKSKVLLMLAAAGVMAVVASGCASVDPTDPSHFTDVLVRNDTPSPVQFVQCDTSCGTLHEHRGIPLGGSTVVNVSNEGITVGYLVAQPDGWKLGCVYMRYEHVKREPTIYVSSMSRCQ
jgi:hypothetical protein